MRIATSALVPVLALLFALAAGGGALAHGNPAIRAEPAVAQPGAQVKVIGMDMTTGVEFVITLERATRTIELGRATAEGEEDEGGFAATFTIPAGTAPGSYTIRAESASGKVASIDFTVTDGAQVASALGGGAAVMLMATADLHGLDRSKTAAELGIFAFASVALAVAGVTLMRRAG